jgi:hypothetical protein
VIRYCCSNDALDLKLCQGNQFGRLIMDAEIFAGKHRFINIPATGDYDNFMKYGRFEQIKNNGKYVLVMANCSARGRPVKVTGNTVWRSAHGYLPGDLFGLMYFFAAMTLIYFGLLLWYGISMRIYEDGTIPIQRWIFATICMGALELFFRTGDLFVWNEDGTRFWAAFYVGELSRAKSVDSFLSWLRCWSKSTSTTQDILLFILTLSYMYIQVSLSVS